MSSPEKGSADANESTDHGDRFVSLRDLVHVLGDIRVSEAPPRLTGASPQIADIPAFLNGVKSKPKAILPGPENEETEEPDTTKSKSFTVLVKLLDCKNKEFFHNSDARRDWLDMSILVVIHENKATSVNKLLRHVTAMVHADIAFRMGFLSDEQKVGPEGLDKGSFSIHQLSLCFQLSDDWGRPPWVVPIHKLNLQNIVNEMKRAPAPLRLLAYTNVEWPKKDEDDDSGGSDHKEVIEISSDDSEDEDEGEDDDEEQNEDENEDGDNEGPDSDSNNRKTRKFEDTDMGNTSEPPPRKRKTDVVIIDGADEL